jgi:molecular chaperone GrpE
MTDETKNVNESPVETPANDAPEVAEEPPVTDRIAELEAELANSKDQTLRLAAELENVRKRSKKAEDDARRYGVSRFAEDMLGVADNLYRALDNVPAEARLEASDRMNQLVEGVEMTQKTLQTGLERHGIRRIHPKGQKFDHNLHQAVAQIPSAEFPTGIVAEVIQDGYEIGERVLRAAMVAVSTGTPAAPKTENMAPKPGAKPGSTIDTKA